MRSTHASEELLTAGRRVVFSCDARQFQVRDVFDTAWVRGELQEDWQRLLQALACLDHANSEGVEPDDEALQSLAEEFRYQRDLLTAQETEQWLAQRDVTEEQFTDFFLRHHWLSQFENEIEVPPLDYPAASPDFRELLRIDLLLSGRFDNLARSLSWRLSSLPDSAPNPDTTPIQAIAPERQWFLNRTRYSDDRLTEALTNLDRDDSWLNECLRMEAVYRQFNDTLLMDEKRSRLLATQRLPLTQITLEMITFRTSDAANEAVLCLREDQTSMRDFAQECDAPFEQHEVFLGDCSERLQQALLSASPGEILAPQHEADVFIVCKLISKTEPHIQIENVRERLDRQLLQSHFSDLTRKRVRWASGWERIA